MRLNELGLYNDYNYSVDSTLSPESYDLDVLKKSNIDLSKKYTFNSDASLDDFDNANLLVSNILNNLKDEK